MNSPRAWHGFVHYGGKLYAFGGRASDTIEIYDMATDIWTMSTEKLGTASVCTAVLIDQDIWVISYFGYIQVWDVNTDSWKIDAANPTTFKSIGGCCISFHFNLFILQILEHATQ
jgi:WD40 repeat protein